MATVGERAKEEAGNWRRFTSFAWDRAGQLPDPDNWAVLYTRTRDSDARTIRRATSIAARLAPFIGGDVLEERHSHWAVGWIEGFAIRVRDAGGEITPAFRLWCRMVRDKYGKEGG